MFCVQDAIATLTFLNDTVELACLTASVSNGITTQTKLVSWITGGVTTGILLASGLISIAGTLGSATDATTGSAASAAPALDSGSAASPALDLGESGSALSPTPALGSGSVPVSQDPTSLWVNSNAPAPMSPAAVHSSLPSGAGESAHPGDRAALALGAAAIVLAAGGASAATTTAAKRGGETAQPHGHFETTAPTSAHSPLARMEPIILFLHFQSISSSGLLSLRYPTIYLAFTVGVFVIKGVSSIQYSYFLQVNFAWANFVLPIGVFKRIASHLTKCTPQSGSGVSSLTVNSVNYGPNQTGIDAYATRLGIPSQYIFGIVYLVFLCGCGALLVLFFVLGFILQIAVWVSFRERKGIWRARRFRWAEMASNNSLRVMVLALGTLATFAFYVSRIHNQFRKFGW